MDAHLSATLENTPVPRAMIYGAASRDIWSVPGAGRSLLAHPRVAAITAGGQRRIVA